MSLPRSSVPSWPPQVSRAHLWAHVQHWVDFPFLWLEHQQHSLPSIWATACGLHLLYYSVTGSLGVWTISSPIEPHDHMSRCYVVWHGTRAMYIPQSSISPNCKPIYLPIASISINKCKCISYECLMIPRTVFFINQYLGNTDSWLIAADPILTPAKELAFSFGPVWLSQAS